MSSYGYHTPPTSPYTPAPHHTAHLYGSPHTSPQPNRHAYQRHQQQLHHPHVRPRANGHPSPPPPGYPSASRPHPQTKHKPTKSGLYPQAASPAETKVLKKLGEMFLRTTASKKRMTMLLIAMAIARRQLRSNGK